MKTNILFAVLGTTPSVLTQTLYALCVKEGIQIHEIEVITTPAGKTTLRENGFFDRESNPINKLFIDYKLDKKFGVPVFNESKVRIPAGLKEKDVTNQRGNHLMEAEITRRLRFLTSPEENSTVFASLSGGRKTMSAYMNLAMTIFARKQDDLFHVLHEGPGGNAPKGWWYPPPKNKTQEKWINLFRVPFLRLREHLEKFVPDVLIRDIPLTEASEMIEESEFKQPLLTINLNSKREFITVDGETLRCEPKSLLWLALLAWRKKNLKTYEMVTDNQSNYQILEEERVFLSKGYQALRRETPDLKFFEDIKDPTYWAPAATRLNKALDNQIGQNSVFLNCYGGARKLGASERCHFIRLEKENIKFVMN